jgi:hypothetical protein
MAWAMRIPAKKLASLRRYTCPLLLGPDGGSRKSRRGFAAARPVVGARRPPT